MKNLNNNKLRQLEGEYNKLQFEYYVLKKRYESLNKRHIGLLILSLLSTGTFITIINLI